MPKKVKTKFKMQIVQPALYFYIYCLFDSIYAQQGVGKIVIGKQNETLQEEYVFAKGSSAMLPVYAVVYSATNAVLPKTEDIVITCNVSTGSGYSDIQFRSTPLLASENSTTLNVTLITVGRAVSVTCSGYSATCNQFCANTSRSNAVYVRVTQPPSVSLCDTQYSIRAGSKDNPKMSARLSKGNHSQVDVTCTLNPSNGLISITNPTIFASGTLKNQILYSASTSTGSAIVSCSETGTQNFQSDQSAMVSVKANEVTFKPSRSAIYNTTFSSVFSMSEAVTSTVWVSCQASVVTALDEAERAVQNPNCAFSTASVTTTTITTTTTTPTTTTTTTTAPPTTSGDGNLTTGATSPATTTAATTVQPTTPPDPTSPWIVTNSLFQLPSTSTPNQKIFATVTTQRLVDPINVRTEIVVTTCCTNSTNQVYQGLKAATYAVAHIAPYVCAGCSNENITDRAEERVFQNPGYVEVAPCSCDLTLRLCDINCCCDTECSALEKARFQSCVAGLPGGQAPDVEDYKCATKAFNPTDWHLVTCVFWENNGYLGMYYQNRKKLKTLDEISAEVTNHQKGKFSLSETERRYEDMDSLKTSYSYGTIVKTVREDIYSDPLSTGTLALSQTSPGGVGACNPLAPVQYLVDSSSTCNRLVNAALCEPLSTLSSRIYAVSSIIDGCSQSFKISSTLTGNAPAVTDVRYYCASNLKDYLTSSQTGATSTAETNLQILDSLNCTDACNTQLCWQYNNNKTFQSSLHLPERCPWDDGYTVKIPEFTGSTCHNAVLEVRYNFEWSGPTITKVTADVVLGNVTDNNTVAQRFNVAWQAKTNSSVLKSDNYLVTSAPYQRSGTAGYNFGKNLASGCSPQNDGTNVDSMAEKQMSIFVPGVDGLCENSKRIPLTFGDDTMSACALRLSFNTLNSSCDSLRKYVLNQLNILMGSNVIGRYGYNNPNNASMWIPVLRQALKDPNDQVTTTSAPSTTTTTTTGITSTGATDSTGSGSTSTALPAAANATQKSWADAIAGICTVPSGVHLNVIYVQTGAVNGQPIYEVTGAYISYSQSNWTMNCAGANSVNCMTGATTPAPTQLFYLSSSVTFIKMQTNPQPAQRKFYSDCDPDNFVSDTCERYFTTFGQGECYYDSCWQELAYPVMSLYQGESRMYTLPFFLVFVLGVIGYVSVARPGWS